MNNPLGVSPSEGNQGTTRGKEKSFDLGGNRTHDLRIRSTVTLPTELRKKKQRKQGEFPRTRIFMGIVIRFLLDNK